MKNIFTALLFLLSLTLFGQATQKVIPLTFNKTVHLFFDSNISYVDAGLEDILWKSEGNMLKLATRIENFEETNLVVLTDEGKAYGFILRYAKDNDTLIYNVPAVMGIYVKSSNQINQNNIQVDSLLKQKEVSLDYDKNCQIALKKKQRIFGIDQAQSDVFIALINIFVFNDKLYFVFTSINNSNIAYDVSSFNLILRDKRKSKKSSIQPTMIDLTYSYNSFDKIPENSTKNIVLVTEKFTVPKGKKLYFNMAETNGGRDFIFYIDENMLAKSPSLIDL